MDDRSLQKALLRQDEDAMVILADRYAPVAKGVIARVLWGYPDLQEDALNETFLAVWLHIRSYDPSRSTLKNWVAGVARYKALDLLRREGRLATVPYEEQLGVAEGSGVEMTLDTLLDEWLAPLSERDRALFRMLFYEGKGYQDVADRLGVSKDSLYHRVARGRRLLRKEHRS